MQSPVVLQARLVLDSALCPWWRMWTHKTVVSINFPFFHSAITSSKWRQNPNCVQMFWQIYTDAVARPHVCAGAFNPISSLMDSLPRGVLHSSPVARWTFYLYIRFLLCMNETWDKHPGYLLVKELTWSALYFLEHMCSLWPPAPPNDVFMGLLIFIHPHTSSLLKPWI